MIKFENVTKFYPANIVALDNVSFEIQSKEFVCLVGKSGAGKTTLLKLILAEERPNEGKIFFDHEDIQKIKAKNIPFLRRRIGAVFQDYKLLSNKTVYENVAYALEVIGAPEMQIENDMPHILEIVGLSQRVNNFPRQLSGGEKQRVALARALIHRPEVILADEPTGNLDLYHTLDIIRLLLKINELGTTIILATHNKEIVNILRKRTITLQNGRIIRDEEKGRFIL